MNIRFTGRGVRVRLDDHDTELLRRGQVIQTILSWPGGGWSLRLDPAQEGVSAEGGALHVGLERHLQGLLDPLREGVNVEAFGGELNIRIEQDYLPQPRS